MAPGLGQGLQVVAVHLHCHVRAHAGDQLVHAHLDRLGELVVVAGQAACGRLDFRQQGGLGLARVGPCLARLEHDEGVGHRRRHRIAGDLAGTDLAEHPFHFGEGGEGLLQGGLHRHRLAQAGAGNAQRVHGDVAFVETGHEFRTQPRGQQAAGQQQHRRAGEHDRATAQRPRQHRLVGPARPLHGPGFLLLDLAAQEQGDGRGDEGQRQQHRAGEREYHGDRHRLEHFSFHPGEGEDRQVHRADDAQAEQAGTDHLGGGRGGGRQPFAVSEQPPKAVLQFAEAAQAVLDDDHRAIDDQAEIQRAQAHQVAGDAATDHAGEGEQHRQRDHRRGDQRGAEVAQQREQHHHHQQRTFDQVGGHGADGAVHQRGAVVDGDGRHPGRQAAVGLGQARGGGPRDLAAVGADQHEHRAQHHLATVHGGRAGAQLLAFADLGHVAHADRHAFAAVEHDLANAVQVDHLARCSDQELLAVALDVAGTDVAVVGRHRARDVLEGETQRDQARRVGGDVDLPGEPALGVDLGDPGHVAQLRADHPVLQRAQVGGRPRRAVGLARIRFGLHDVHEDLAHAGGNGPHLRFDPGGQLRPGLGDALADLLAGEVQVGAVLEHHRHLRQPVARQRAGVVQPGQAGQRGFQREGHPLFGLQWREARRHGIHLHLHVGDVGGDVDRQLAEAPDAHRDQRQGQGQHQPAPGDGEADDAFERAGWRRRRRRELSAHARPPPSRCRP